MKNIRWTKFVFIVSFICILFGCLISTALLPEFPNVRESDWKLSIFLTNNTDEKTMTAVFSFLIFDEQFLPLTDISKRKDKSKLPMQTAVVYVRLKEEHIGHPIELSLNSECSEFLNAFNNWLELQIAQRLLPSHPKYNVHNTGLDLQELQLGIELTRKTRPQESAKFYFALDDPEFLNGFKNILFLATELAHKVSSNKKSDLQEIQNYLKQFKVDENNGAKRARDEANKVRSDKNEVNAENQPVTR